MVCSVYDKNSLLLLLIFSLIWLDLELGCKWYKSGALCAMQFVRLKLKYGWIIVLETFFSSSFYFWKKIDFCNE